MAAMKKAVVGKGRCLFIQEHNKQLGYLNMNAYNRFCRDGIYFDKILVSEYKLFKRSNKANLFIALVQ
jgi:hypothetical protein